MPWEIDKSRTKLEFAVRHMMIQTVRGTFRDYDVELDIDAQNLSQSVVKAHISTQSVTTKDGLRDSYLVSRNFFNPEMFPHMVYESTSARLSGTKLTLNGRLKIRDQEQPLLLSGTVKGPAAGFGSGPRRLSFDLRGTLDREAYKLVFNGAVETVSIVVGKKVDLLLSIDLVETPA
jgi:polyisoprenoid-binding protein YceI